MTAKRLADMTDAELCDQLSAVRELNMTFGRKMLKHESAEVRRAGRQYQALSFEIDRRFSAGDDLLEICDFVIRRQREIRELVLPR